MSEINPYQPPTAHLSDAREQTEDGTFNLEGRTVSAGRGAEWIMAGLRLSFAQFVPWLLIGIVMLALTLVLSFIPLVNMAVSVGIPAITGGIVLAVRKQLAGGTVEVGDLFSGFREKGGPLLLVGVLYLAVTIGVIIVAAVIGGLGLFGAIASGGENWLTGLGLGVMIFAVLVAVLISMAMYACIWLAPALVVFHDVAPFEAMKRSFLVSVKNWLPLIVYGLVGMVFSALALIPLGLGFLILVPAMMASTYFAYRDIFIED
ncbi:BPSS1780 family membrane protein [Niveibacterium sp. SC-1]|uniref:BPSS1780 family membrane protein n=1 Tax=Niveibacterium sp. SC-1 TaxID=3135646 RepID=UPI00311E8FCA